MKAVGKSSVSLAVVTVTKFHSYLGISVMMEVDWHCGFAMAKRPLFCVPAFIRARFHFVGRAASALPGWREALFGGVKDLTA